MANLLEVHYSTGFLGDIYTEGTDGQEVFLAEVARQIRASDVVHFDETSARVGKANHYFHVTCTELLISRHGLDPVQRTGWL